MTDFEFIALLQNDSNGSIPPFFTRFSDFPVARVFCTEARYTKRGFTIIMLLKRINRLSHPCIIQPYLPGRLSHCPKVLGFYAIVGCTHCAE
ncbi:hypothetical protein D3C87_558050 [compost metagenome]